MAYDSRSDVWSLGLTLLQLAALDDFPFRHAHNDQFKLMTFLERGTFPARSPLFRQVLLPVACFRAA